MRIASELVALNDDRKEMTAKGVETAVEIYERDNYEKDRVLVIYLHRTEHLHLRSWFWRLRGSDLRHSHLQTMIRLRELRKQLMPELKPELKLYRELR